MFDNLSSLFAAQSKESPSERASTMQVQESEESGTSTLQAVKAQRESKDSASKSTPALSQTRKAVQSTTSILSENRVSQKKDQDEIPNKTSSKDVREIKATLDDLNARLESHELNARFTVDEDSNRFVVQLVDSGGQVIRQIPSEDSLEFARNAEKGVGVLVDKDL